MTSYTTSSKASSNTKAREPSIQPSGPPERELPDQPHALCGQEEVFGLTQAILDEVNCMILAVLAAGPVTAADLVRKVHLPMTTCYRRLTWLTKKGLVREHLKRPKGRGGPYRLYTSLLESLSLRYEGNSVKLALVMTDRSDEPLSFHQSFSPVERAAVKVS